MSPPTRCLAACVAVTALATSLCAQPPDRRTPRPAAGPPEWVKPLVEAPRLQHKTFHSPTIDGDVSYLVYLPAAYERDHDARFPVLYWLHGIGGAQTGVPRFVGRLDAAIEAAAAPPMIVVFVNGLRDSFYCDAADGTAPVETVIVKDLIPHVDGAYRTTATREARIIEGFSMGGFGAAHLGFKYPELFGAVSLIDSAMLGVAEMERRHPELFQRIFAGQRETFAAEDPRTLGERNADSLRGRTTVRIAFGAIRQANATFHDLLTRLDIPHEYELFPDAGHNHAPIYDTLGERNWAFYRRALGLADAPPPSNAATAPPATTANSIVVQASRLPKPAPVPDSPPGFQLDGIRWTYRDDALSMQGILLKPDGDGPFPAIVISHGLGAGGEQFGLPKAREFVRWGLVCIAPDLTHTRGAADRREFGAGPENIRRAIKCVELLSALPYVDRDRIGAYGNSMGAFLTVGLAAELPDRLKAAAITAGGVTPRDGFPAPSTARAESIRTPFLILHGTTDTTVPPDRSLGLKEILDRNNVANDRRLFDGIGHDLHREKADEVYTAMRHWFQQHGLLPPAP
jgi:endo-1,4-beta-xylanase